ncbi:glycerophosphodiester phosphodiesterase family protein [Xanthomonas phaseoli]|uniref:Glycerophosphodiester phosphodiesterase 1 n=2 Tax=Xanthomonas TaxID=338 RepID=A0A1V9HBB1_9XANT|nr:glycerophosphodiester phosphodiesterase family protein [Xanthomonas phaseoli]MBO9790167.1 glycerophosphodiester phosphodiesterase family protein [Xanthomonas phaseoli pv. dieffenbachiae]MBO9887823.1 glycerophosphodiester phosphodiesterase family protein [Xanthomonas phaseoli pv. dieffenbachiae]MBO9916457.1 glycerophosphodiester phosphodiesterase family protein [Xanthomonas phaseoli pv. dieffenbachiae]MBO9940782.1 glycerophosphodiester phosphodiesterase family protein [Xanthomonas phaseoli pv
MKRSTRPWKKTICTLACLAIAALSGAASAANNWNPQHILGALKRPHQISGVSIAVIAHRGVVSAGCPENSSCSILATYNNNVEAIELDVKQSADGTPWLFHDQNVGRLLEHSPNFNIFQAANNPTGWNPDVRTLSNAELNAALLRDRNFAKTGYHPVTLTRALTTIRDSANHMVIVLDLKTLDAVSRAADLARAYGMENQVVLKFSASLLARNPDSITNYTKGVAFAPTIYAGDMDNLADGGYVGLCGTISSDTPFCRVNAWISQVRGKQNFAWLEIGNKQPRRGDPTAELLADNQAKKEAIGAFSPVSEYRVSSHDGYHFVRSNGTCCAALSDYLTRTKHFGDETADERPNYLLQVVAGFTSIITDDPLGVIRSSIKRDTTRYL